VISIIIPTLNEQSVLDATLAALKKFTSLPHEVIVSDGHSTDGTLGIAKRLADKVVEHDGLTRQNISQGRNAGAAAASGEFLVFLDADAHIPEPDQFFAEALKQFESNPKLVALTVNVKVFPEMATLGDKIVFDLLNWIFRLRNNVLHIGESTGEFQMIRANAFQRLHGFREDLVTREDADMFYRLSDIGLTKMHPKLTVYHTGRRAHKIGWAKLLWIWTINSISVAIFSRAVSKEWKVIR
jgi:glycosyltransferase involved in cell wall biosynthesis